ncbi:MAG TPA: hypothetical protein PKM67_08020 [Kiritimatiellia bacterium]|nr:hypothetical protein [Kiritimatiellia bacterium]
MKKTVLINAVTLLMAFPVAASIAWLALAKGITRQTVGMSRCGMIIRDITTRPCVMFTTNDPVQNIVLVGPPLLFLALMILAVWRGWRKSSYTFSGLAALCWVLIATLSIYAHALP